ncbi:MAG: ADP-ribosylglycohydrolase family protein [Muribaculaceae bacterium]|nr:ADP-ribosylglycohydrolase family protein [Muribaculaceae bacterium]
MELNDRIRGAIVGFAFGDALGLGSVFMTRNEVDSYYPDGLTRFDQQIRDAHRLQWQRGEWTNDTEIVVRLLENVLSHGSFDIRKQAKAVREWYKEGHPDVSPVFRVIVSNSEWLDRPIQVAHEAWRNLRIHEASNEAVQRSLVAALVSNSEDLLENTRKLVLMTNDDTRCVSTAMILSRMMHSLLHHGTEAGYEELAQLCNRIDPRTLSFLEMAFDGDVERMQLDDEATWSWTRKAMGAGLWSLWHFNDPAEAIQAVVMQGGDSDTNAAISGALIGLKYGYSALPAEKLNLVRLDYLLDLADRVTEYARKQKSE